MKKKNKIPRVFLIIALAIIILVGAVAGFLLLQNSESSQNAQTKKSDGSNSASTPGISLDEVAKHTGKNGNSCWVAVDGTVYEISGFVLWLEGEHRPSGGRAKCGKDLSEALKQSPHGKSKLRLLKEIGPLQQ